MEQVPKKMLDFFLYLYIALIFSTVIFAVSFIWRRIKRGGLVRGSLSYVLYELTFSHDKKPGEETELKKIFASMEQFYSGMMALGSYYVLEIGLPYSGDEVVFYCSVPSEKSQLFEKQIQGVFHNAIVSVKKNDYNIFKPEGFSLASSARLKRSSVLPIKTWDKFETDPLQLTINTFSKLQKEGEGAALQIVVSPSKRKLAEKARSVSSKMKEGVPFMKAFNSGKGFAEQAVEVLGGLVFGTTSGKKDDELKKPKPVDEETVKLLDSKASKHILDVNVRLLTSAENKEKAKIILEELESAFMQFQEAQGNSVIFEKVPGSKLSRFFYNFSFRLPDKHSAMPLNLSELSSIFHFPSEINTGALPQLKYSRSKESAPPINLPENGLLIGKSSFRGEEKNVYLKNDDRRRHVYIIGQTGVGKSVLIKNMIIQDIEEGRGVCFIDPHGQDLEEILARIPKERADDLIYFNPGNVERPMGLNMLEYDRNYPEQKTLVVNEILGIFNKLFNMKEVGGPMFEQYFRNSTILVMEDPDSGNTLFEVARVLSDKAFRDYKLSRCNNPIVSSFWKEIAEKTGGEHSLQNMVPWVTSKFDNFLSNDIMRPIIGQNNSSFNFRKVMDEQKILLVNLSKGRLGDLNSNLLGLIIVGKLLMASLSRVDTPESERKDFYLYIDEFQNVTTDSISTILSEARKYRLNLNIAHQYIGQLEEGIKKAVFGNVGSMAVFRINPEDGEVIEKFFEPSFSSNDMVNLDNYNAYIRMLVDGQTTRPFNIKTIPFYKGDIELGKKMGELSSLKYGRPKQEVEEEIRKRYNK